MITIPDPDAANRWKSYMQGWKDGACGNAMKEYFTVHDNEWIRLEYNRGYTDGHDARRDAAGEASFRLNYFPSILRTQE